MKNGLFLLIAMLLTACTFDSQSSNQTTTTKKPVETPAVETKPEKGSSSRGLNSSKPIMNWTIIPNQKVGLIQKDFTESAIIDVYGKEHVNRQEIGLGEGETSMATVVFPNTDNEIFVVWKIGQAFTKIDKIIIENENTPWITSQGITIGTTLEELIKINGKNFQFAGFEWDNSGYTNDWQGGKIAKNLVVFLEPTNPEAVYPDLLGDDLFSSSNEKAKQAGLKVRSMEILF